MKSPSWYKEWRHEALHQLIEKQDALRRALGFDTYPRYDYDLSSGTLTFSEEGQAKVVADIQVVGTVGQRDWLWSWANDHWPEDRVADLHRVRAFGFEHGIEELTTEHLIEDDLNQLGWQMTAVAARILGAPGAYRPEELFLLCRTVERVA